MTKMSLAGEVKNVFVYGSLLAEEVVRILIGRIPPCAAAYLTDYHRYSIEGRSYPAIAPKNGGRVVGLVYFDLTDHEQAVFDEFESEDYERCLVDAVLMVDGTSGAGDPEDSPALPSQSQTAGAARTVEAHVYSWADPHDPQLYGTWDYEEFREKGMPSFLRMCSVFRTEMSRQWGPPPAPVE
ncbi:hypothetical protein KFL_000220500 [Klebsormidium nitens]|uniref:Putative gamma-glutamylcyclotransferase n=1 Tax=Klebsormidium nitens TaxID=105231 RepID=A0A1Y1HQZ7_KLENI|nr:hypothetical protein KFL_000220500 [Klebsormidium nitens]|eukprot:GAQ79016.1 hypothetical protein KFL_000220500 [Klebsormidium nitens]